ncbi:glycerophosphodiester phosphodiesterase GDPDL7 isoform X2 [Physcomitrium patens]|uniref:glycerophosphodiester phosphodiesterase n=1 Tax=Physcomitrium patens TaxID=3218 RepID=A0A2K1L345_PHYPA|nr:glycerophosphodiester phosphodiesterase GDPDL7-like isoform X2 [Physcomitrium patens]PNR60436.1 hypothetical protein PHYPA_003229 [Physcomitrium patens]|eukprot:XP_024364642.1 glycerophosphodiester phosphodiesterase GDPDL7-like isoform X2 [Physcomitrella patens]
MEKKMNLNLLTLVVLVTLPTCFAYNATIGWQTFNKGPPLVIANGGTSGLYPDQTLRAYRDAANSTSSPLALLCDLMISKDNFGICRPGFFLEMSTNTTSYPATAKRSTYSGYGQNLTGYFANDFTLAELLTVTGMRTSNARPPIFTQETLAAPENVSQIAAEFGVATWINVEFPEFFQEYPAPNSLLSYLTSFLKTNKVQYLSVTNSSILKLIAPTNGTRLVLKLLDYDGLVDPLFQNLTDIATYAQGVLVPNSYVIPKNFTGYGVYEGQATTAVQDAHKAGLEIFVYGFANDRQPYIYNYSKDPVLEVLSYVGDSFTADGIVTDFPNTAATAIHCYPDGFDKPSTIQASTPKLTNPIIIAEDGASGDLPGSTMAAYLKAIDDGADYIECKVQITSDGVPICRDGENLLNNTNIGSSQAKLEKYYTAYPDFGYGVFSFDVPSTEIQNLRGIISRPNNSTSRDPANDGKESILTLKEFLNLSKIYTNTGLYVNVQNAYKVYRLKNLDMVSAVATALAVADLTNAGDKVLLASEDTSALNAFQEVIPNVRLVYVIANNEMDYSVPREVLKEIKKYADTVHIYRSFIDRIDPYTYFVNKMTSVVQEAKALNMTVFYASISNEYLNLAFDYRADPHLKMYYLLQELQSNGKSLLDGFLTVYPATVYNFLNNNYCYRTLGGATNRSMSGRNDPIYRVYPDATAIWYIPPAFPVLNVTQGPVSYGNVVNATPPAPPPKPSSSPSLGSNLPFTLLASAVLIFILNFTLQQVIIDG